MAGKGDKRRPDDPRYGNRGKDLPFLRSKMNIMTEEEREKLLEKNKE